MSDSLKMYIPSSGLTENNSYVYFHLNLYLQRYTKL